MASEDESCSDLDSCQVYRKSLNHPYWWFWPTVKDWQGVDSSKENTAREDLMSKLLHPQIWAPDFSMQFLCWDLSAQISPWIWLIEESSVVQWLLGFLEKAPSEKLLRHQFPSKVGGRPVGWTAKVLNGLNSRCYGGNEMLPSRQTWLEHFSYLIYQRLWENDVCKSGEVLHVKMG